MNIFKKIIKGKKLVKQEQTQKKITFDTILNQLYIKKSNKITFNEIQSNILLKEFVNWNYGIGFNSYSLDNNSIFTCIKQVKDTDMSTKEIENLMDIPQIENLLFIKKDPQDNDYVIPENFRFHLIFNKDNRKDILYKIDNSVIYQIIESVEKEPIYFLIEKLSYNRINKLLENSRKFVKSVHQLMFLQKYIIEENKDIVMVIDKTDEFMAGRFFLPKIISNKPVLTTTQFKEIRLTTNSNKYNNWIGLCFDVSCKIENKSYNFYYLFDLINMANIDSYKDMFSKLLKIVLKSNIKHFKECGLTLNSIQVKVIQRPKSNDVINSVDLNYYLKSSNSLIHGHIIIPMELISFLILKIAPPWTIIYTNDSLKNRLRSFLSLNRELYSQGLLSLIETDKIKLDLTSINPIQELRDNFIKLHDILDLLSVSESQNLITNYLYQKGWSGRKLKRIFYYLHESNDYETKVILPLSFFNEDKFTNYLMKNMKDEWLFTSDSGYKYFSKVSTEHFYIIRDLYNDNNFPKSTKLKSILDECFSFYYSQIDLLLDSIKINTNYTNIKNCNPENLIKYFNNNADVKYLFYYVPEHLKFFEVVLQPGQFGAINNTDIDPPEHKDDWLEHFIKFRSVTLFRPN